MAFLYSKLRPDTIGRQINERAKLRFWSRQTGEKDAMDTNKADEVQQIKKMRAHVNNRRSFVRTYVRPSIRSSCRIVYPFLFCTISFDKCYKMRV